MYNVICMKCRWGDYEMHSIGQSSVAKCEHGNDSRKARNFSPTWKLVTALPATPPLSAHGAHADRGTWSAFRIKKLHSKPCQELRVQMLVLTQQTLVAVQRITKTANSLQNLFCNGILEVSTSVLWNCLLLNAFGSRKQICRKHQKLQMWALTTVIDLILTFTKST